MKLSCVVIGRLIIRRRSLYPAELRGRIRLYCFALVSSTWKPAGGRCCVRLGGGRSIQLSYGGQYEIVLYGDRSSDY